MPTHLEVLAGQLHGGLATVTVTSATVSAGTTAAGVKIGASGVVYRGSARSPASAYSGFPSLVRFDDQHLGCAFTLGPSDTSIASRAVFARTLDVSARMQSPPPPAACTCLHLQVHLPGHVCCCPGLHRPASTCRYILSLTFQHVLCV